MVPVKTTVFCLLWSGIVAIDPAHKTVLDALYNSTGGANWTTTWDLGLDLCGQYGVTCDGSEFVTVLNLKENNLNGTIPPGIWTLLSLDYLNLDGNPLSGTIRSEIGNLQSLRTLYLSRTLFSGTIPQEIGSLSLLQYLQLSWNNLNGTIPAGIWNLTALYNLDVYANHLAGQIPPEIGNLILMEYLDLGQNEFSGQIPPEIGNLILLGYMDLSKNLLNAAVPPEIGSLILLEYLWLNENELSGQIPAEIGNLTSLLALDLYKNQFSGPIPPEIGNMVLLEYLYFSENQLTDQIPVEIGNLISLIELYFTNNTLTGQIPVEIGNLISLVELSFYTNQFSGQIPPEIGNLILLQYLDFEDNQFSGPIPSEIGNLNLMQYLYFSDNQLSGPIPLELGNLESPPLLELYLAIGNNFSCPYFDYSSAAPDNDYGDLAPCPPDCCDGGNLNCDDGPTCPGTSCGTCNGTDICTANMCGPAPGSGNGDPIIYGFDGGWFHFMGYSGRVYNLISDSHFQLNSLFISDEFYPQMTWMGDLGIMIGEDSVIFHVDGSKTLNGEELVPSLVELTDGGKLTAWEEAIGIEIPNYELYFQLYENPPHFNVHADYTPGPGSSPHGVIGQTTDGVFRYQNPEDDEILRSYLDGGARICTGLHGAGCIDGDKDDYEN